MKKDSSKFDAIVVLGQNITRAAAGKFVPTTYQDSDMFGMLGGQIKIVASVCLYLRRWSNTFVFSTGVSKKTREKYGPDAPTEAKVYSEAFLELLADERSKHPAEIEGLEPPKIVQEDRSVNTVSNIEECLDIIRQHSWEKVMVLSTRFHIPRIQALWGMLAAERPVNAQIVFVNAEDVVQQMRPGEYDAEIEAAYKSPMGQKRLKNEQQGLLDLEAGHYHRAEFQKNPN